MSEFIEGGHLLTDEGIHQFDDYASYSTSSLRALHENSDDDKAFLALADRSRRNGDYVEARELYREAVVSGFTRPLIAWSLIPEPIEGNCERPLSDIFVETNTD